MSRVRSLSLSFDDWPERDRAAWSAARQPGDSLYAEVGGATDRLSTATLRKLVENYSVWLSFLARSGQLSIDTSPAARVSPAGLDSWVADQRARRNRDSTISGRLMDLHHILRLMEPQADVAFICRPRGVSLRRVLPPTPRPFQVVASYELLQRALALFEAGRSGRSYAKGGTAIRDAALLGLLAAHAPRIGSIAKMRIGTQIERRAEGYLLDFGPVDTKTRRRLTFDLHPDLVPVFDAYIQEVRGRRVAGCRGSDALWAGTKGIPLSARSLTKIVLRRTAAWFGVPKAPHWFRKCLRSSAKHFSPEAALDAAIVLGHSHRVSVMHYNEAGNAAALRRHGERIRQLRRRTRPLAERSFAALDKATGMGSDPSRRRRRRAKEP